MRTLSAALILTTLSALLLTPALAQHNAFGPYPTDPPPALIAQVPPATAPVPAKPEVTVYYGRVLDAKGQTVNGVQVQQATMAIYIRADSADAPGTVPADKAQLAANMKATADQLESPYKTKNMPIPDQTAKQAKQLRDYATELLHWREIDTPIASNDATLIPISGIERVKFDDITAGTRIHVFARVDKQQQTGAIIDHVQLVRDAVETTAAATPLLVRQSVDLTSHNVFYELVGDVTTEDPLTIDVGPQTPATTTAAATVAQKIKLDVPDRIGLIQRVPQQVSDLYANERFTARVKLNGPLNIAGVDHFTVFINVEATTAYDNDNDLNFVRPVGPPVHPPSAGGPDAGPPGGAPF